MAHDAPATDAVVRSRQLLQTGAAAEMRLLKQERKAERRLAAARKALADDEAKLERARARVARSLAAVAAAEADLKESQARRAAGPLAGQS
jgi:hypothetical protein